METNDGTIPRPRTDTSVEAALTAYQFAGEDRKREYAKALLEMAPARDFILERLRTVGRDERGKLWAVVVDQAKALIDAHDPNWPMVVVRWLGDGEANWEESANVCAETGFYASLVGMSRPFDVATIRDADATTPVGRAMLHLHIAALRLAYRWAEMASCLRDLRTPVADLDPFLRAFYVFGLIVDGHHDADREMARLLEEAPDNYRVHLALVEALRLSNSLPGPEQGRRMLELLDRPALRGSTSPDPLYRRAFALRRMGKYEEALRTVDDCLARLPVRQVQDRVRIIQEHDLIMAERAISEQRAAAEQAAQAALARHVEELRGMVGKEVEDAQRLISDALFRSVEVLGLFIAIIALLTASLGSAAATDLIWWQRAALVGVSAIVVLLFFYSLRAIVRPRRRPK